MASYTAGADVNAIVLDFGCASLKAGFAGEDVPRVLTPTTVGVAIPTAGAEAGAPGPSGFYHRGRAAYAPFAAATPRPGLSYRPIVDPSDGLIADWDAAQVLLERALVERMGLAPRAAGSGSGAARSSSGGGAGAGAGVAAGGASGAKTTGVFIGRSADSAAEGQPDLSAHPVLLSEPLYASKADREKWAQLMFEQYGAAGVFMSRGGVLAVYANARTTGLAVDLGAGGVSITPVHDGFPLMGGARRSPVGGLALDAALLDAAAAKGVPVPPRLSQRPLSGWAVATGAGAAAGGGAGSVDAGSSGGLHPSVVSWHRREVARDARESVCRVADAPFDADEHAHVPTVAYDLPDGSQMHLGAERYALPELLFNPSPLALSEAYAAAQGVTDAVLSSLMGCDPDMRRELLGNLVLTGGLSATEGLQERLSRELAASAPPGTKARIAAAGSAERRLGPWLGGSILASLGTFPDLWFSKAEYAEFGAKMLHRKVV